MNKYIKFYFTTVIVFMASYLQAGQLTYISPSCTVIIDLDTHDKVLGLSVKGPALYVGRNTSGDGPNLNSIVLNLSKDPRNIYGQNVLNKFDMSVKNEDSGWLSIAHVRVGGTIRNHELSFVYANEKMGSALDYGLEISCTNLLLIDEKF